jgi:hypothetical protein
MTTKEDGVILVFEALHSNNPHEWSWGAALFDSLSLAHQQAKDMDTCGAHQQAKDMDTCGDFLRLCVRVSLTSISPEELRGKANKRE